MASGQGGIRETVALPSLGAMIPAYVAGPGGMGPGVVVLQEVFGVNAHIRAVCDRLGTAGYWAIAPHLYHRQAPGFAVGYSDQELAQGRVYKEGTTATELLADIEAAIAHLQTRTGAPGAPVGCMGFCFGGHVAYLAATLPAIAATASFYGAGIPHFTPGGGPPTLTRTPEIRGTLYGFFGQEDPLIPQADVAAIAAALQNAGTRHRLWCYPGATHGFFCDQRASYHPAAAADAWNQVLDLFQQTLGTGD